jgi:hypothetical protein
LPLQAVALAFTALGHAQLCAQNAGFCEKDGEPTTHGVYIRDFRRDGFSHAHKASSIFMEDTLSAVTFGLLSTEKEIGKVY